MKREITARMPKSLRVLLIVLSAMAVAAMGFILLVNIVDGGFKGELLTALIISGVLMLLVLLLTFCVCNWSVKFKGRDGIYTGYFRRKKEFHASQIASVQVSEQSGMTVFDREQKKLFCVGRRTMAFWELLIYMAKEGIKITYMTANSELEAIVKQEVFGEAEGADDFWEKNYYKEQTSKKVNRTAVITRVVMGVSSIGSMISLAVASRSGSQFMKSVMLGVFFALLGLTFVAILWLEQRRRKEIKKGSVLRTAQIVSFERKDGANAYPVFEFEDQNGLHLLRGFDTIKVKRKAEENVRAETRQVYYNADVPIAVLDAEQDGIRIGSIVGSTLLAGGFLLAAALVVGIGFFIWHSPEQVQGDKMRVDVSDSYKKSKLTQADVDSDTVQWICAAYAIYTQENRKELGKIGGAEEGDAYIKKPIRVALESGWDISGRASAKKQIEALLSGGHRSKFRTLAKEMKENGLMDISLEELQEKYSTDPNQYKYTAAYEAYHAFGEHGLDGWDLSRALQVIGDCYQAEYLNLEECLDQSLKIAKELQKQFHSWDELARSYLYGYQFWEKDNPDKDYSETGKRWKVYEELAAMEAGPYSIPYDTKLQNTWKDVAPKKIEADQPDDEDAEETKKDSQKDTKKETIKADPDGYYNLKRMSGEGSIKVEPPEGFSIEEYSSEYYLNFADTVKKGSGYASITYGLFVEVEDMEAYFAESAKSNAARAGEKNAVYQEIQTKDIDGISVSYIYYYGEQEDKKEKGYSVWWTTDGKDVIKADVREAAKSDEELDIVSDEEILTQLVKGVRTDVK